MSNKPKTVFFDANIIIGSGKPPGDRVFNRIIDLVKCEFIQVITTDLTITEIAKKYTDNDYSVIKEVGRPHFRKIVSESLAVDLPEIKKSEIQSLLSDKYYKATKEMFKQLNAKKLSIDSVKPSIIFSDYEKKRGLFTGESKKDQFPDAFILECLKSEAKEDNPIWIISDDKDFLKPVEQEAYIHVLKSIPELFGMLKLEIDPPQNIAEFLEDKHDNLLDSINTELENWELQAWDVEDAYIEEKNVLDFEILKLTTFDKVSGSDEVIVFGTLRMSTNISFTHPDWDRSQYDREDNVLYTFGEVSNENEIELEADFSLSIWIDEDEYLSEITEFKFRNDRFANIELYPYDPRE